METEAGTAALDDLEALLTRAQQAVSAAMRAAGASPAARVVKRFEAAAELAGSIAKALTPKNAVRGPLSPREREIAQLIAAGVPNKAIAQRLCVSLKTVEKHVTSIYERLGVHGRAQLAAFITQSAIEPVRAGNLPMPLTPFVGRADDLQHLCARLPRTRLTTLTGIGGCGKTRLAIEAARRCAEAFGGGLWFVDVAPLTASDAVPFAIAGVLGIALEPHLDLAGAIAARLRTRPALLILDNCEHVLTGLSSVVRSLLRASPKLAILATSRERLGMIEECTVRVDPMTLDDAVELFHGRLESRSMPAQRDAEERLCQRVDCVPLALELIAAQIDGIALDVDVPRHRTIEATIEWSYDTLRENERRLFRALSVFRGVIPRAALRAFGTSALGSASVLQRKSLLELVAGGGFRMLEIVRGTAQAMLEPAEHDRACAAMTRHFCRATNDVDLQWARLPVAKWLAPLIAQEYSILAALDWALLRHNDVEAGAALAAGAARVWNERAREVEFEPYLAAALAVESRCADLIRGRLWLAYARFCDVRSALDEELDAALRSRAFFEAAADRDGRALALLALGCTYAALGKADLAVPLLDETIVHFRATGGLRAVAAALNAKAMFIDGTQTFALLDEVLAIARSTKNRVLEAIVLSNLGDVLGKRGDVERARESCRSAVAIFEELGAGTRLSRARVNLAQFELGCGSPEAARREAAAAIEQLALLPPGRVIAEARAILEQAEIGAPGHVRATLQSPPPA